MNNFLCILDSSVNKWTVSYAYLTEVGALSISCPVTRNTKLTSLSACLPCTMSDLSPTVSHLLVSRLTQCMICLFQKKPREIFSTSLLGSSSSRLFILLGWPLLSITFSPFLRISCQMISTSFLSESITDLVMSLWKFLCIVNLIANFTSVQEVLQEVILHWSDHVNNCLCQSPLMINTQVPMEWSPAWHSVVHC